MRSPRRAGAGLAAAGALILCCALGPGAVVAGVAIALGGLGLAVWMPLVAGILLATGGTLVVLVRRRRGSRAACSPRAPTTATGGDG